MVTAGGDTVHVWDLKTNGELFSLRLPCWINPGPPLWDFSFRLTPPAGTAAWLAVPLTKGELVVYEMKDVFKGTTEAAQ